MVADPPMWTPDYDPYADEDEVVKEEIRTLVNYYINELKFRYVSKYKILNRIMSGDVILWFKRLNIYKVIENLYGRVIRQKI